MSEYLDRDDPERSASYRSAVHAARKQGFALAAVRTADGWTVTAYALLSDAELSRSASTPADAAWHVLAEIQDGQA
jgi:hypothetical protein